MLQGREVAKSSLLPPPPPRQPGSASDGEVMVGKAGLGNGWSSQPPSAVGTGGEEGSCVAERPEGPGPKAARGESGF